MPKSSPFRGVTLFRPTGKWRAQISANGRTTSLGDHDTQEAAAAAFDRAAINKDGAAAKTNFDRDNYAAEMTVLASLTFNEIVAELRARARKGVGHSSHFRGVSLLRATGRWHAQINAAGQQVHLGFFATEAAAARAYDRAALAKAAQLGGSCAHVQTNFDSQLYREEVVELQRMSSPQLLAALARDPLASLDPEPSGHSPCHSSDAAAPSEGGWFEGDIKALAGGGPSSRGNSNASSMDILPPHHYSSEAASPPAQHRDGFQLPSPGREPAPHSPHSNDAYFSSGLHSRAVQTGSSHLRDPQPNTLQAQLRALNHLPFLPPRGMTAKAALPDSQHLWQGQQQPQQPPHWRAPYLSGHAVVTTTAVPLPQDGWLSPARAAAGGATSGVQLFRDAAAVAAPPSPELLSPERPHRDSPQRASRRQAARRGGSAWPAAPEPLHIPRQRVTGVKREAAVAQLAAPAPAPAAVLQPPRNRRKGHPMRAAT